MEEICKKYVSDSYTEQVQVVRPPHLNGQNRLFGGQLAMWIDEVAGVTARRHCCGQITTAAIDNLIFRHPVFVNETVLLRARVTHVGNTSLEVRVDSYVESMSGERRLINTAFVIQVAVDDEGHPQRVPGLFCRDDFEKKEFAAGQKRKELRKIMRKELYE